MAWRAFRCRSTRAHRGRSSSHRQLVPILPEAPRTKHATRSTGQYSRNVIVVRPAPPSRAASSHMPVTSSLHPSLPCPSFYSIDLMDFFSGDPIALWVTLTASIVGSPLDARRTRDSRSFARSSPRAPGGSAASSAPARSSFAWKVTARGLSSSTSARATGTRADASTGRAVVCAGQGAKIHEFRASFGAKSSEILATSVLQIVIIWT